jgi:hypothetical protein
MNYREILTNIIVENIEISLAISRASSIVMIFIYQSKLIQLWLFAFKPEENISDKRKLR